jgi:hypothetical protein
VVGSCEDSKEPLGSIKSRNSRRTLVHGVSYFEYPTINTCDMT